MSDRYAVLHLRGGKHRGVCGVCGWSSADTHYPGFAESRVMQHVQDKHGEAS